MFRITAGLIAWSGLGIIVAEILNNSGWITFRLPVPFVVGPTIFVYLFYEAIRNKVTAAAAVSADGKNPYKNIHLLFHLLLGMIGLCFLLSIPFLWWGVIKKLAMIAGEGKSTFYP